MILKFINYTNIIANTLRVQLWDIYNYSKIKYNELSPKKFNRPHEGWDRREDMT